MPVSCGSPCMRPWVRLPHGRQDLNKGLAGARLWWLPSGFPRCPAPRLSPIFPKVQTRGPAWGASCQAAASASPGTLHPLSGDWARGRGGFGLLHVLPLILHEFHLTGILQSLDPLWCQFYTHPGPTSLYWGGGGGVSGSLLPSLSVFKLSLPPLLSCSLGTKAVHETKSENVPKGFHTPPPPAEAPQSPIPRLVCVLQSQAVLYGAKARARVGEGWFPHTLLAGMEELHCALVREEAGIRGKESHLSLVGLNWVSFFFPFSCPGWI